MKHRIKAKIKQLAAAIKSKLTGSRYARTFGNYIFHHDLWHFQRRSVILAAGIGAFIAFTPTFGVQTLMAIVAAMYWRMNLPITILMCYITNPFTIAFVYFMELRIGLFLLGMEGIDAVHIKGMGDLLEYIGILTVGSLPVAVAAGFFAYFVAMVLHNFLKNKLPQKSPHVANIQDVEIDNLETL